MTEWNARILLIVRNDMAAELRDEVLARHPSWGSIADAPRLSADGGATATHWFADTRGRESFRSTVYDMLRDAYETASGLDAGDLTIIERDTDGYVFGRAAYDDTPLGNAANLVCAYVELDTGIGTNQHVTHDSIASVLSTANLTRYD